MIGSVTQSHLTVRGAHRNGVARIALQGELDLATVPLFQEQLGTVVADGDGGSPPPVILDLRGVTFMDSTGLRAVLDAVRDVTERGQAFATVGVRASIRKVFELTRTEEFLNESAAVGLIRRFTQPDGEEAGA